MIVQPKHKSVLPLLSFSPVRTHSCWITLMQDAKCSHKKLEESIEKVVGGNYLQKMRVLILCNLRCSATQQLSLSLALAGPYCVVRITWKQGMECTALIPFLHLITHYFRMLTAPWLQSCLQKRGSLIPLCSTLSPREKGLAEQLFTLLTYMSH